MRAPDSSSAISEVLDFCFAEGPVRRWFVKDQAFDAQVQERLARLHELAASGACDTWRETPAGCLALCILLDQVPRNLFRGQARAFAHDAQARAVTRHALARGFNRKLPQEQRLFLYLPLQHNEDLADQELCVRLVGALEDNSDLLDYAVRHRDIIARFGRFPHRNAALGRESTAEEAAFLSQPGSSF